MRSTVEKYLLFIVFLSFESQHFTSSLSKLGVFGGVAVGSGCFVTVVVVVEGSGCVVFVMTVSTVVVPPPGGRGCAEFWIRAARRVVVVRIVDVRGASQFLFFDMFFFFWAKRVTREGWKGVKGIGGICAAWAGWPTTGRQAC